MSQYPYPAQGWPANTGSYPPNVVYPYGPGYPTNTVYPPIVHLMPYPNVPQPAPGGLPPANKLQPDVQHKQPLSGLVNFPGYEGLTFDNVAIKPPAVEETPATPNNDIKPFLNAPSLTDEEAREALLEYVSEKCCNGSKPAKQMDIRDINFNSAIHYKLETYVEKREAAWAFEPFEGQVAPIALGGKVPGAWEMNVINDKDSFVDLKKHVEVPNTSHLRPCHKCKGLGCVKCNHCQGNGGKTCNMCKGIGHQTRFGEKEKCRSCDGSGKHSCSSCHGKGSVKCDDCKGSCQLRIYIKLTITWKNHVSDEFFETAEFPKELIRDVSGDTAFKDVQRRVCPVTNFPDRNVNNASKRLVEKHRTAFPKERILTQRQEVRIVPIAEVDYSWKSNDGKFFVYGFEKKVHFPKYPATCCFGCQII